MTEKLEEYVVTLRRTEDQQNFYNEMNSKGTLKDSIPERDVEVAAKRELSRSTHYWLTALEAAELRKDERVVGVAKLPGEMKFIPTPLYSQHSDEWNRSNSINSTQINWGLIRTMMRENLPGWGTDYANHSGSVLLSCSGRNVDVVVVDGHINPYHPEYSVNSDGTGGSRVVQYNWLAHRPEVTGESSGTYEYSPYYSDVNPSLSASNNHGAHVAGTICGSRQGWAKKANIYNISPYEDGATPIPAVYVLDYIRAFHRSKPVNNATGRKNPTVVNNSWGFVYKALISDLISVTYRGVKHLAPFTPFGLISLGIYSDGVSVQLPVRYTSLDLDVQDAINEGIIFVGAASNDSTRIDVNGGLDYSNWFESASGSAYYHRGSSPGSAKGSLCVGALQFSSDEGKTDFSNCGPRVDLYAPGEMILSSVNHSGSFGGVADLRNTTYKLSKISGTSMASPQVCGVIACLLEAYPRASQLELESYLVGISKSFMYDGLGGYADLRSLQGSPNRILHYANERPETGQAGPKMNHKLRTLDQVGMVFPRTKIYRYGK